MGHDQDTRQPIGSSSRRRLGRRTCLRKGCGQVYQSRCWNQRYCQDPDCLREVRRWQAAKRQRVHRQSPGNRKRHADEQARRRQQQRATPANRAAASDACSNCGKDHRAWSRSKRIPDNFCDRPGCYESPPTSSRAPSRYCGCDCRRAVRRVLDRERKWLSRNRSRESTPASVSV